MSETFPQTCWICSKILKLETCKIDENGHPVHEVCYVAKVALKLHSDPLPRPTGTPPNFQSST
jgi:hypothetical protein